MKHTRVVSTKCTPGFACRAFSDTTLVCFIVNEHTTKCSRYKNMHTVFALLCFVVVIHWLIFPYPSGLLHWHCGNLTIAPVPAKQPWWIWINTSCEFIMNNCITTTRQSTTKPCAHFLGYTVLALVTEHVTFIVWSEEDPVHWSLCASTGINELINYSLVSWSIILCLTALQWDSGRSLLIQIIRC